jgi:hypothetical protein
MLGTGARGYSLPWSKEVSKRATSPGTLFDASVFCILAERGSSANVWHQCKRGVSAPFGGEF